MHELMLSEDRSHRNIAGLTAFDDLLLVSWPKNISSAKFSPSMLNAPIRAKLALGAGTLCGVLFIT